MRVLVTGASGFAGAALLSPLLEAGYQARALARERARFEQAIASLDRQALGQVELAIGDVLAGTGLAGALRGIDVAYYLIHSMEPARGDAFPQRDRRAAENFARAACAAGVQRIVYLGGPLPHGRTASAHLTSRYEVERIIMRAVPGSVTLRASIAIGARSRSFRFLVRLVERLPVIALPAWRRYRVQPIDERDIVEMLLSAASAPAVAGRTLEVGGPDVLTYGEMLERIAELMLLGRPTIGLPVTATPIAARLAAVLARETPELVLPLMEGLTCDLLLADDSAARLLGVDMHSFDAAVEHALRDWEAVEPLAAR
jgi:uncharacterized protein YbjT (DUF2867 family)